MNEITPHPNDSTDVRIPAESLRLLARSAEPGTARALRDAGRRAGEVIGVELAAGCDPEEEPMGAYWATARESLASRGLGQADYDLLAPGVAEIRLSGTPESEGAPTEEDGAGCPFTTGLLAGLLSETAGSPVALLEVECRARGDEICRFLAGAEQRLRDVRREILSGATVEEAVEAS